MSPRAATRLAWSLWALSILLAAAGTVFYFLSISIPLEDRVRVPVEFLPVVLVAFLAFPTVGALVASRRPGNAIGWIFCAFGVALGAGFAAQHYADYTVIVEPGALPGGGVMVWLNLWPGPAVVFSAATFLFLLFPEGRLRSRRWRPVVWVAAGAAATTAVALALRPGLLDDGNYPGVTNPVGIDEIPREVFTQIGNVAGALAAAALVLSIVSLLVRLRRSRGVERQQLKWIVYAGAIMVAAWAVAGAAFSGTDLLSDVVWAIGFIGFVGIPIATGFAILHYRLYEIDLIIRRTLVYGALTALLAGTYFGIVLALQQVFSPITQGSDLAIAGSTLAVAAAFRPARRRIQELVDRRFYRSKVDAQRTLEGFAARLRQEIDLDALSAELRGTVQETMQPAHVSLWLRVPEAPR